MIAIKIPMKAPIAAGDVSLLEKGIPLISAPINKNRKKCAPCETAVKDFARREEERV